MIEEKSLINSPTNAPKIITNQLILEDNNNYYMLISFLIMLLFGKFISQEIKYIYIHILYFFHCLRIFFFLTSPPLDGVDIFKEGLFLFVEVILFVLCLSEGEYVVILIGKSQ